MALQSVMLLLLYAFLYFPIFYIIYRSFMENSVWPFPPVFTGEHYETLGIMSDFHEGLWNSVLIGLGTGLLSTLLAGLAVVGLLKYPSRLRGTMAVLYLAPLFVAHVLIGISTLMSSAMPGVCSWRKRRAKLSATSRRIATTRPAWA